MSTILDKIVATKREEIARARRAVPEAELAGRLADAPPVRDFFAALSAPGQVNLLAEVKRASPSKGVFRPDFDPVLIAQAYARAGAAAISVLTDEVYFQGALDHLAAVRQAVAVPVLRKDFILDRYQLLEARVAGADAVLLIAECLDDCQLRSLHNESLELGMTPLVELYEPANLARVLEAGARLVGINNRDLHTFVTDLGHTERLCALIPDECTVVSESGIGTAEDVARVARAGASAILVGESLIRQPDVEQAAARLVAACRQVGGPTAKRN